MKSALLFVVTLAVFILVGWMNARLWFVSDEQRIHRLIERGRLSLENGSILSFHTILSEAYQDRRGADRTIALQYLNQFFEETKNRKFQLHHLVIHLDGDLVPIVSRLLPPLINPYIYWSFYELSSTTYPRFMIYYTHSLLTSTLE